METYKTSYWRDKMLNHLSEQVGEPICHWLHRRYLDDLRTYREITKELGINIRTLMKLMRACNIEPRNPSKAVAAQWVRNPARRKSQAERMRQMSKGKPSWSAGLTKNDHPGIMQMSLTSLGDRNPMKRPEIRAAHAKSVAHYYGKHPQPQELAFMEALDSAGIDYVFQPPFGPYILDFAFVAERINVEIESRSSWGHEQQAHSRKRTGYLERHGWYVLHVRKEDALEFAGDIVRQKLIPLLKSRVKMASPQ